MDAKGVNNDGTAVGGQGFLDPRIAGGDIGHPLFEDETGPRNLIYNPIGDLVPREPATIIHDSNPSPTDAAQTVAVSDSTTLANTPYVRSLIQGAEAKQFTVKIVENPLRSTFPDTGLANTDISVTRNLNYLKEPTTNRLARGIRGNTDTSDPRVSGIVFEKMNNRKAGQMEIATASGKSWSEPKVPWRAIYPYNHVHQTESGHIIEMDDTPNWERLHWYHRTGTFTEIHPTGIKVDKIVNNYYDIMLASRYTHIESNDFTTIDGNSETFIQGSRQDKVEGDYSIAIKKGRFNVNNPLGWINLESENLKIKATETLTLEANQVNIKKKTSSGTEETTGDETKKVGGKFNLRSGSTSFNAQGSIGMQSGGGLTVNATDSIQESIFGLLPMASMGYSRKTDATLGKIGFESKDNILSGGIEMNLGIAGLGAGIAIKPLGDIELTSNLGLTGIKGSALLGDVQFSSLLSTMKLGLAGDVKLSGLLASLALKTSGSAQMSGLLGEVTIGTSGKVKVKGLMASLGEILKELIDQILNHTHPTGTGPSGPPMPPASVQLNLLKSLKIGMSLE